MPAAGSALAGGNQLANLNWPELAAHAASSVLVVPLGSTEQHGPHLPLGTDTAVAVTLAQALASSRPDVIVAPEVPYGSSGEHAGFAGTLSIGQDALERLLVELGRSADAFAGVLFVSAHGGNAGPLGRAVALLQTEGRNVRAWCPSSGDTAGYRIDAHAGHTETSLMLAIDPDSVQQDRAEPGRIEPIEELVDTLRCCGVAAVSSNGVLGDPSDASAKAGSAILAAWADQLRTDIQGWP